MYHQENLMAKDYALALIFKETYNYLSNTEKRLIRKIIKNKYYPFTKLSRDIYELEYRNRNCLAAFLVVGLAAIWIAVVYIIHIIQMESHIGVLGALGLSGGE